jgi:hypothetical protein
MGARELAIYLITIIFENNSCCLGGSISYCGGFPHLFKHLPKDLIEYETGKAKRTNIFLFSVVSNSAGGVGSNIQIPRAQIEYLV